MALEIERKWLIDKDKLPFSLDAAERHHIVQSYLSFSPQVRLRAIDDAWFVMTIKGKSKDADSPLVREEREFALSREAYLELRAKTEGRTIAKVRYIVPESDVDAKASDTARIFEIDVFEGDYAGLAMAEMEFATIDEAESYPMPSWALLDVSEDMRFRNVAMAQADDPSLVLRCFAESTD
ncbi:MAG: hypothetical protein IJJ32_02310 [Eggerthellaceae bacterium]|nr:hypothetical protein [Eggerthellaceae bacterium]